MTKFSPLASRAYGLLWTGMSVSISVSNKFSFLNCISRSLFNEKNPIKLPELVSTAKQLRGGYCPWALRSLLLLALLSFTLIWQMDVLFETVLLGMSCWRRNFPLCVQQCKQTWNQLQENANHLHSLAYIQVLFPEGITLFPRLHVCTSKYDINKNFFVINLSIETPWQEV